MDVLLLTLSGAGSTYLSRQCWNHSKSSSFSGHDILWAIAVGLSGLLFALNLLELLPPSWFLWIQSSDAVDVNRRFYGFTLTEAYRIVLWSMAIHCVTIIPSAMGIHLAFYLTERWKCLNSKGADKDHPSDDDADEKKKRSFLRNRPAAQHWTIRFGTAVLSNTVLVLVRIVHSYALRPVITLCWKSSSCGKEKTLPRTLSSDSVHSQRRIGGSNCPNVYVWLRGSLDPTVRRCVLWGCAGGMITACLMFMWISPFVIDSGNIKSKGVLTLVISWLCAVGILLSTLLNGFGCVSLPYSCMAGFFLNPIPEKAIANAEQELEQLKSDWKNKMQELESPDTSVSLGGSSAISPPKRYFSWRLTRREFSDMGDAVRRRKATAMSQMEFLNTLIEEMSANVEEMRHVQMISLQARTRMGRIKSWMGVFFSLILLSRLYAALSNVGHHFIFVGLSSPQGREGVEANVDPISRILLFLSGHQFMTTEGMHNLSQCISLILSAVLSVSQIKVFLRVMTSIQQRVQHFYRRRWYCRSCGSRDLQEESNMRGDKHHLWFLSHPLSLFLCCYSVACTVLTKMMLPPEYRTQFSRALYEDTEHQAHPTVLTIRTDTVDLTYSCTALVSGLILAILLSILRSNVRRYNAVMDGAYYQNHASKETV
jgi:Abscisic acid G-protein coupled receptor/The Golgi pH Regulator (GPHR) Family N-terminal